MPKKAKAGVSGVLVGFAHVIRGYGTPHGPGASSVKGYRSKPPLEKPWAQVVNNDMDVNKWAKMLGGAYDLPQVVGSPGAAESEAAKIDGLDPTDAVLAIGVADVEQNMSTCAVPDVSQSDDSLGVLDSMIEASFSGAEGLGTMGCTVQVAAVAVTSMAVVKMAESRPLRGLGRGLPALEPKAMVRVGASSVKAMILANMLGAASAQGM